MKDILCLVLGGGRGTRLYPLTKDRSKPAVPFAGKYRLVDIPISNSLNSGMNHIYVLTQFNSESLNKHIARTYKLDSLSQGFVDILAADQSMDSTSWFQGTADAVRRTLKHFNDPKIKYVLVLSGDQLYKMDFTELVAFHKNKGAQITIACNPVDAGLIKEFGIMCIDGAQRITNFIEKPQDESQVQGMATERDGKKCYLASMGIYLFNKNVLTDILEQSDKSDFGRGVIPDSFPKKMTCAYVHEGYWRDIGTIKSFYEENLIFTDAIPPFDMYDENWPFFTRPRNLPPAKIEDSVLDRAIVGEGSILHKCRITHSVIGLRSRISDGVKVEDSIIMGADYYQSIDHINFDIKEGVPPIGIGRNTQIRNAIVDKNARIGERVRIVNEKKQKDMESTNYCIKDGIVIVHKNAVIPSGVVI